MKEVIYFCFKDKQGKYSTITKYSTTWVITLTNTTFHLIKSLKLAIN